MTDGTGPPGPRNDEDGPLGPADVEKVVPTPPITNTCSYPTAGADAHSKGTDRRGGGKTPKRR